MGASAPSGATDGSSVIVRLGKEERVVWCVCPFCRREWSSAARFLQDPSLRCLGMQADANAPRNFCHYYFLHLSERCGATFMLDIRQFRDFVEEGPPRGPMTLERECPRLCLDRRTMGQVCANECFYAPYRKMALRIERALSDPGVLCET